MKGKIKSITQISLCVAILSVISQITIPIGAIPITLQTFIICVVGYTMGIKKGITATVTYILVGLVGMPVFASFNGGLGAIVGYTGGFIIGFIPLCAMCGIKKEHPTGIALGILGALICHLMGITQYVLLSRTNFLLALVTVSLPYFVKDIFLVIMAYTVSRVIRKRLKNYIL